MKLAVLQLAALVTLLSPAALAAELINFTSTSHAPNGAWCWYQDERVVVDTQHPDGPLMLIGTVSFSEKGDPEEGDIDVLWHNLNTGEQGAFELHDQLQPDDHDVPSFHIRPDGRYVALYSKHSSDNLLRYRITKRPHDPTDWEPEQTFENSHRICYTNPFQISTSSGAQLINFSRSINSNPCYFLSADHGATWKLGGVFMTGPGGNRARGQRPYMKYASTDGKTVHFTATDGHPRDENNGIYHGFLRDDKLYFSDGKLKGDLATGDTSPHRTTHFTTIMKRNQRFNGVAMQRAWTIDLHLDDQGQPYTVFSARADGNIDDHRFFYARWTGREWFVREIAKAGGYLFSTERDYTGLVALHPHNPNVLFISTTVDPRNGRTLKHYEIFIGQTSDGGDSWAWSPVTWKSDSDNLRPVVPLWDADQTALLWLRGSIRTFRDWEAQVVGHIVDTDNLNDLVVAGQNTVTKTAIEPEPPTPAMTSDFTPANADKVARAVARWQIENFDNPDTYGGGGNWRRDKWDWVWGPVYCGLLSVAQQLGDDEIREATRKMTAGINWSLGPRRRFADDWAVGWSFAEFFLSDQEPRMIAQQSEQFDALMKEPWDESLEWKDNIAGRELAWCDALFMGPPTLSRLATATGDQKYLDFADKLWWKTTDYLYNTDDHLYYRDGSYFNRKEPNGKQIYWSRGNGWVYAGLARLIEDLPADYPSRQRYETLFKEMSAALLAVQKPDGFWPTGLLDPERWDKPETSGTAFYTYGMAWGINHGLLEKATYLPAVKKGWQALTSSTNIHGRLSRVQPIGADPYDFDPESVMPYGVGGAMLAAAEIYQLTLLHDAPSFLVTGENTLDIQRLNETIEVPWSDVTTGLPGIDPQHIAVRDVQFNDLLNTQAVDNDGDGQPDVLLFQAHFQANQTKEFRVYKVKHTRKVDSPVFGRAVPERLDDFAWENDRIAFRIYGPALEPANDAGSGIDVWTKAVRYPVVNKWYKSGDYHADHGEGGDFYKVGKSRGAGGVGIFAEDQLWTSGHYRQPKLLAAGPVRVIFEVQFDAWDTPLGKVSETKRISLDRGSNLNRVDSTFKVSGTAGSLPVAIGLVHRKDDNASQQKEKHGHNWAGIWEPQNGWNGRTGVGLVIPGKTPTFKQHTQTRTSGVGNKAHDETNTHTLAIVQAAPNQPLTYYVGAGWSKSANFKISDDWFDYLQTMPQRIANPIKVSIE